jgi:hypothetical protein
MISETNIDDLTARRGTGTCYEQLVNESRISQQLEAENKRLRDLLNEANAALGAEVSQ